MESGVLGGVTTTLPLVFNVQCSKKQEWLIFKVFKGWVLCGIVWQRMIFYKKIIDNVS